MTPKTFERIGAGLDVGDSNLRRVSAIKENQAEFDIIDLHHDSDYGKMVSQARGQRPECHCF